VSAGVSDDRSGKHSGTGKYSSSGQEKRGDLGVGVVGEMEWLVVHAIPEVDQQGATLRVG
jgi:hypothetical protein